jgi:hypothetical protein
VLADHPLVYLRFGEKNGSTTAVDETGQFPGHYPPSGVTMGVPGALGDGDTAIHLDGTNGIDMPASVDLAPLAKYSLEVWLWVDPSPQDLVYVLDHQTYDPRQGWDLALLHGGHIATERWTSPLQTSLTSNVVYPTSTWHHVFVTFDSATLRLYVDAVAQGVAPSTVAIAPLGGGWRIGAQNCQCAGETLVGALDELAVYGDVLTLDRVQAHIHAAGR